MAIRNCPVHPLGHPTTTGSRHHTSSPAGDIEPEVAFHRSCLSPLEATRHQGHLHRDKPQTRLRARSNCRLLGLTPSRSRSEDQSVPVLFAPITGTVAGRTRAGRCRVRAPTSTCHDHMCRWPLSKGPAPTYVGPRRCATEVSLAEYPKDFEFDVLLRDGRAIHLRPIRPDDAEPERAFISRVGPESSYFRFFS